MTEDLRGFYVKESPSTPCLWPNGRFFWRDHLSLSLCVLSGLPVVSVGSTDRSPLWYLGEEIFPPSDSFLHLCPHPLHEDQSMVRGSVCVSVFQESDPFHHGENVRQQWAVWFWWLWSRLLGGVVSQSSCDRHLLFLWSDQPDWDLLLLWVQFQKHRSGTVGLCVQKFF